MIYEIKKINHKRRFSDTDNFVAKIIGLGPLAKIISLRGNHVRSTWLVWEVLGSTLPPKKFPSKKLPNTEKKGDQ
jgi:hypothetical protein